MCEEIGQKKNWKTLLREIAILATGLITGAFLAFLWLKGNLIEMYEADVPYKEMVQIFPVKASGMPGWTVSREYCKLPGDVAVFELCHKQYAGKLLTNETDKEIAAILPCSFALYETAEGKTRLVRINARLASWLTGGNPRLIFRDQIGPEQDALLKLCGFQKKND